MSYRATFLQEPSHLHARFTGSHSRENVLRFLEEAHDEGVRRKCSSLLLEIASTGTNLDSSSIYHVVSERSRHGTRFRRIAYVDTSDRNPERMKFAENVAINRGANVRLFRDLEEARAWIAGSPSHR